MRSGNWLFYSLKASQGLSRYRPFFWVTLVMGLVLTALAGCRGNVPSDRPDWDSAKASVPLDVQLTLDDLPTPDKTYILTLTATPLVDAPRFLLTINLPTPLLVTSGAKQWEGPAVREQTQTLNLRVRVPDEASYTVRGVATLILADGARFTQTDQVVMGPTPSTSKPPTSILKPGRGQEQVIESQGQTR